MCCVRFVPNIKLCVLVKNCIPVQCFFAVLFCIFVFLLSVGHLGHYCGVTTMLLIHPQFSPITAIELCSCFKITNGVMVTSEQFPSCPAAQFRRTPLSEGHLYLWCVWVGSYLIHSIIINLTILKEIFNVSFVIVTHLPITALLYEPCEKLPGLCCWICAWN